MLHQWDKLSHKVGIDVKWKTHNVAKKHNGAIQCQQHKNQNEYSQKRKKKDFNICKRNEAIKKVN